MKIMKKILLKLGEKMKKADKLNLAIGICFSRSNLTPEQCDLLSSMSIQELTSPKYGYNENQSREILKWCQMQCQKNQASFDPEQRENANRPAMHYYRA